MIIEARTPEQFFAAIGRHPHARCEVVEPGDGEPGLPYIKVITGGDKTAAIKTFWHNPVRALFAREDLHNESAVEVATLLRRWGARSFKDQMGNFGKVHTAGMFTKSAINPLKSIVAEAARNEGHDDLPAAYAKARKWELRVWALNKGLGKDATIADAMEAAAKTGSQASLVFNPQDYADDPDFMAIASKKVFYNFTEEDYNKLKDYERAKEDAKLMRNRAPGYSQTNVNVGRPLPSEPGSEDADNTYENFEDVGAQFNGDFDTYFKKSKPGAPLDLKSIPVEPDTQFKPSNPAVYDHLPKAQEQAAAVAAYEVPVRPPKPPRVTKASVTTTDGTVLPVRNGKPVIGLNQVLGPRVDLRGIAKATTGANVKLVGDVGFDEPDSAPIAPEPVLTRQVQQARQFTIGATEDDWDEVEFVDDFVIANENTPEAANAAQANKEAQARKLRASNLASLNVGAGDEVSKAITAVSSVYRDGGPVTSSVEDQDARAGLTLYSSIHFAGQAKMRANIAALEQKIADKEAEAFQILQDTADAHARQKQGTKDLPIAALKPAGIDDLKKELADKQEALDSYGVGASRWFDMTRKTKVNVNFLYKVIGQNNANYKGHHLASVDASARHIQKEAKGLGLINPNDPGVAMDPRVREYFRANAILVLYARIVNAGIGSHGVLVNNTDGYQEFRSWPRFVSKDTQIKILHDTQVALRDKAAKAANNLNVQVESINRDIEEYGSHIKRKNGVYVYEVPKDAQDFTRKAAIVARHAHALAQLQEAQAAADLLTAHVENGSFKEDVNWALSIKVRPHQE